MIFCVQYVHMLGSDEEFVAEEEAEEGSALVKKLRERLKKAVEEKQEYLEGWQRSRADFANFKREEASMHGGKEARIKAEFVEELLPALDSFAMALQHAPSKELTVVHKQLTDALKKMGIEQFGAAGEVFDPYKFEALQEVPTQEEQKDHIVENVRRSGYAIGEKIIRPAQVSVFIYKK